MRRMPVLEAFELYSKKKRSVRKGFGKCSRHTGSIRGGRLVQYCFRTARTQPERSSNTTNGFSIYERKGNWLFEKHSTYSEKVRRAFGECSGVIYYQTTRSNCIRKGFGMDSRRMLGACGKHSAKIYYPLHSGYSERKLKIIFGKRSEAHTFWCDSAFTKFNCFQVDNSTVSWGAYFTGTTIIHGDMTGKI